jgi:chromosomal replication initiation ATPase DnaA
MLNLALINNKVSSVLKEENNEVVYRAWLSYTEDAYIEDGNLVINVPNQYIKETFEERYISDIEALYRSELDFSKLLIRTEAEEIVNTFEKADSIEYVNSKVLGVVEKIMLSSKQFSVSL